MLALVVVFVVVLLLLNQWYRWVIRLERLRCGISMKPLTAAGKVIMACSTGNRMDLMSLLLNIN